jgi:hypothetical protein
MPGRPVLPGGMWWRLPLAWIVVPFAFLLDKIRGVK